MDLRGNLYPRRAPADNHEGELGLRDLALHQGNLLEALDHTVADDLGVFDTSHGQTMLLDTGDAEEVRLAAQRDHELVVRKLQPSAGLYNLLFVVYSLQLSPPEARSGRDQGAPQGLGDIAGLHLATDDR